MAKFAKEFDLDLASYLERNRQMVTEQSINTSIVQRTRGGSMVVQESPIERTESVGGKKSTPAVNRFTEGTKVVQSSTQDSYNFKNFNIDGLRSIFVT